MEASHSENILISFCLEFQLCQLLVEKSAEHQQLLQGENKIRMTTPAQEETMCAGWTWYLANDFQFFLVSPVGFHFHILTYH